jgi:hypothetical protein
MPEQWEYKVTYINAASRSQTGLPDDLNDIFDQWGIHGWELVATEGILRRRFWGSVSYTVGIVAFFKRRIQS